MSTDNELSHPQPNQCLQQLRDMRSGVAYPGLPIQGVLTRFSGHLLTARGCVAQRGEICHVKTSTGDVIEALATGFDGDETHLFAFDHHADLLPGAAVSPQGYGQRAPVGYGLLGRVIDSVGDPMDGGGHITNVAPVSLNAQTLNPLRRAPIEQPLDVGVRAINSVLTLGRGQRVGLFAASGLGKSVLLGMMTRHTAADITVVCLLGERGREVREFVETILGPEGLKNTVVVAVPADHTALRKVSGARYANAIAEYFRDRGHHVLLLVDSLTRYAHAGRELGLAAGELPVASGYPPSVMADLPLMLERAGCSSEGSVTAVYTLLMEATDTQDPLAEVAKSFLDGHIILSRALAESGHFPAIDILASASRLRNVVTTPVHQQSTIELARLYSHYQQNVDLLSLGMYHSGADPLLDEAIAKMPAITALLQQSIDECFDLKQSIAQLQQLLPVSSHTAPAAGT